MTDVMAGVLLATAAVYLITGGADFGAGIWELVPGPRSERRRKALARAIAPIWEANHVWLIVMVVILFVCFPRAHSTIMVSYPLPIALLLLGVVLRGAAFAFRSYSAGDLRIERDWTRVFRIASLLCPLFLGVTAGAIAGSAEWYEPFPILVGLLVVGLCAYLAAVYMMEETKADSEVADDFRRAALGAHVLVAVMAAAALWSARVDAPHLFDGLVRRRWSIPFQLATGAVALAGLHAVWQGRSGRARILAAGHAILMVVGWGLAQYPYIVAPTITVDQAAAPTPVLVATGVILAVGIVVSAPLLLYLYRVFKAQK